MIIPRGNSTDRDKPLWPNSHQLLNLSQHAWAGRTLCAQAPHHLHTTQYQESCWLGDLLPSIIYIANNHRFSKAR